MTMTELPTSAAEPLPAHDDHPSSSAEDRHLVARLAERGPLPSEYEAVSGLICRLVGEDPRSLLPERRDEIFAMLGAELATPATVLGHSYCKPYGYAGDFEIIDKLYTQHVSREERAGNWDRYLHTLAAPRAVRNRKTFFKVWLQQQLEQRDGTVRLLNLASGPARDLAEFFADHPDLAGRVEVDCVEQDPRAIEHAQRLLGQRDNVRFHCVNVFKFRPQSEHDLIWSAGLFDYFEDAVFVRVLRRFLGCMATDGEVVVGNFDPSNPSLAHMAVQDWHLHHRTAAELRQLAAAAGATGAVSVDREPAGVNLFLRVRGRTAQEG